MDVRIDGVLIAENVSLKPGWVAKDADGGWWWYQIKPLLEKDMWWAECIFCDMSGLDIDWPEVDYKESLLRVVRNK